MPPNRLVTTELENRPQRKFLPTLYSKGQLAAEAVTACKRSEVCNAVLTLVSDKLSFAFCWILAHIQSNLGCKTLLYQSPLAKTPAIMHI